MEEKERALINCTGGDCEGRWWGWTDSTLGACVGLVLPPLYFCLYIAVYKLQTHAGMTDRKGSKTNINCVMIIFSSWALTQPENINLCILAKYFKFAEQNFCFSFWQQHESIHWLMLSTSLKCARPPRNYVCLCKPVNAVGLDRSALPAEVRHWLHNKKIVEILQKGNRTLCKGDELLPKWLEFH